jgi:DNA-binding NarL/FixJ family response regulator
VREATRIVVVDDHELFRKGLGELFAQQGFDVVGEAADGNLACELVDSVGADVVVMDLDRPGMDGLEATRRLSETAPHTQVIAFTVAADATSVIAAIAAGACGYVVKDAAVEELISAVRAAAAGQSPISPRAAGPLFDLVRSQAAAGNARPLPTLTGREVEVLRLLAEGKSNIEIGQELFLSPTTVKHHTSSILAKLGVGNRIQAAVEAVRAGIV